MTPSLSRMLMGGTSVLAAPVKQNGRYLGDCKMFLAEDSECKSGIADPGFFKKKEGYNTEQEKCATLYGGDIAKKQINGHSIAVPTSPLNPSDLLRLYDAETNETLACSTVKNVSKPKMAKSDRTGKGGEELNKLTQKINDLAILVNTMVNESQQVKEQAVKEWNAYAKKLNIITYNSEALRLYRYQVDCIAKFLRQGDGSTGKGRKSLILQHPVGSGKTVTAISIIRILQCCREVNGFQDHVARLQPPGIKMPILENTTNAPPMKVLILCPHQTSNPVWVRDLMAFKIRPVHVETMIDLQNLLEHDFAKEPKSEAEYFDHVVFVVRFTLLSRNLINKFKQNKEVFDLMIVDEVHNATSKMRGQVVKSFARMSKYTIGLSGTAVQNRLSDLSAVAGILEAYKDAEKEKDFKPKAYNFTYLDKGPQGETRLVIRGGNVKRFQNDFGHVISHKTMREHQNFDRSVFVYKVDMGIFRGSDDESIAYDQIIGDLKNNLAKRSPPPVPAETPPEVRGNDDDDDSSTDTDDDMVPEDGGGDASAGEEAPLESEESMDEEVVRGQGATTRNADLLRSVTGLVHFINARGKYAEGRGDYANQKTVAVLRLLQNIASGMGEKLAKDENVPQNGWTAKNRNKCTIVVNNVDFAKKLIRLFEAYNEWLETEKGIGKKIEMFYFLSQKDMKDMGMQERDRQAREFCEFEDGTKMAVLLLSMQAGGEGLRLVDNNDFQCSTMIIANLWWNSAKLAQVIARIYRPPQKSHVDVYIPCTKDTIEESIIGIIGYKSQQALVASSIAYRDVLLGRYHSQLEYKRLMEQEAGRYETKEQRKGTRSATAAVTWKPPSPFVDGVFEQMNYVFDTQYEDGVQADDDEANVAVPAGRGGGGKKAKK